MSGRRLWLVLVLALLVLTLLRPRAVWAEIRRLRRQWSLTLGLLVAVILAYLLYGLYMAWQTGGYGRW